MSLYEVNVGRQSSGFAYMGRCIMLSLDIGMHIKWEPDDVVTAEELKVRHITFWSGFGLHTAWSLFVGRIPLITKEAIVIPEPYFPNQSAVWTPYTDKQMGSPEVDPEQDLELLQYFISLSMIVHDTLHAFYSPRERFTAAKLLGFHARFEEWFSLLPERLKVTERATGVTAPIIILNLYYHSCVIHLFRPLIAKELVISQIVPRTVCTQHAYTSSGLVRLYRIKYGSHFRHIFLPITHTLMTALLVYTVNPPGEKRNEYLTEGVRDLWIMAKTHAWAMTCYQTLCSLAKLNNRTLPSVENLDNLTPSSQPKANTPTGLMGSNADIKGGSFSHELPSRMASTDNLAPVSAAEAFSPSSTSASGTYSTAVSTSYPSTPSKAAYPQAPSPQTHHQPYIQGSNGQDGLFWSPNPAETMPIQFGQAPKLPQDMRGLVDGGMDTYYPLGFKEPTEVWTEEMVVTTLPLDWEFRPKSIAGEMSQDYLAPGDHDYLHSDEPQTDSMGDISMTGSQDTTSDHMHPLGRNQSTTNHERQDSGEIWSNDMTQTTPWNTQK